jgi:hypothetical protein
MSTEITSDTQITCLEKVHEDILYSIECLVEDYTREARSELGDVLKSVAFGKLDELYRVHIETAIKQITTRLVQNSYDRDAKSWLVKLRRQIRNTIAKLHGMDRLYNYADAIEL